MFLRSSRTVVIVGMLACASWLVWGQMAHASVDMRVDSLAAHEVQLRQLHLQLERNDDGSLQMSLVVGSADVPALGWRHVRLQLDGKVTRSPDRIWIFAGKVAAHGTPGGMLAASHVRMRLNRVEDTVGVKITQGSARVEAKLPLDQPSHARIRLRKLPLAWLQGLLSHAWKGRLTKGRLDGTVALDVAADGIRSSGRVSLSAAGFEGEGGTVAGQALNAQGHVAIDTTGADSHIVTDLNITGGELLLGSVYAHFPAHAVHLALDAQVKAHEVALPELRFTDPGAMHVEGTMVLAGDGALRNVHLTRVSASLPAAYERYGKTWLQAAGYSDLATGGELSGSLWRDSNGWKTIRFQAQHVNIDGKGGLGVQDLSGGLDWERAGTPSATRLAWQQLRFHDITLGAAKTRWRSRAGRLSLLAPVKVPVLGGQLRLRALDWSPEATKGRRLDTSLDVTGVDVARLCQALGWPEFQGTLAGSVPSLHVSGEQIVLDGGLSMSVFDGHVDVTRMSLRDPFGTNPVLTGDVAMRNLDLEKITQVFDFGRITGRLDGHVDNLRLVDWKPVAFKASLATVGKGRISQRAVHNLTSVGGGGAASGVQSAVLKLFKSFGYKHIGLSCTLKNKVCDMTGLKPVDDGYLIVDGRGLPHLKVIGHQHHVSWPTLVGRLKAAVQGGGPVVQ